MRSGVLALLRASHEYISGGEIARRLSISRTAVWKHINVLKENGYVIDSHQGCGYRLVSSPDLLLPEEIDGLLTTDIVGQTLSYCKITTSTNVEAQRLAQRGCADGLAVIAEEQTAGRGRLARSWFSPYAKGIWVSVVLRPPFAPQCAPKCTLMAAVAVRRAILAETGLACGIKWPNDILWDNHKIVGIRTELSAEFDRIHYMVVGIGINVNSAAEEFPADLQDKALSLAMIKGQQISRQKLLAAVLNNLDVYYQEVLASGFDGVLDEWRSVSATLGQNVRVLGGERELEGLAVDIDADGALLVKTATGTEKVLAGDVSIRNCSSK